MATISFKTCFCIVLIPIGALLLKTRSYKELARSNSFFRWDTNSGLWKYVRAQTRLADDACGPCPHPPPPPFFEGRKILSKALTYMYSLVVVCCGIALTRLMCCHTVYGWIVDPYNLILHLPCLISHAQPSISTASDNFHFICAHPDSPT